jgi:predicted CopG family antitoxin
MSKTISIDREAYEILKSRKLEGESYSDVIKKEILPWKSAKELNNFLAGKIGGANRQRKTKHEPAR